MKPLGSVAAVVAAIGEDAALEVEAIERQAESAIARLRAEDTARPVVFLEGDGLVGAARERARARAAHEDWLDSRAAIDERDVWMQRAVALGQRRLAEAGPPESRRRQLVALAKEGIGRLHAPSVEVVVGAEDAALLDRAWCSGLAVALETITVVAGSIDGGCVVRTSDGRASFDNTYAARADRLRTIWRAALAELYERAVQPATIAPAADPPRRS